MIPNQTIQSNEKVVIVKKKSVAKDSRFSFLTDFTSTTTHSKTLILTPNLQLVSRITTKGKIKFCNTDFVKVIKTSSKIIQNKKITNYFHPEMPKVILNIIKNRLDNNKHALGIIKQKDIDGNIIWLNSLFSTNTSNNLNIACQIKSNPSSEETINKIEKIYNTIHLLENHVSYDIAQKYFDGLLEMEYGNYEGFLINAFQ